MFEATEESLPGAFVPLGAALLTLSDEPGHAYVSFTPWSLRHETEQGRQASQHKGSDTHEFTEEKGKHSPVNYKTPTCRKT